MDIFWNSTIHVPFSGLQLLYIFHAVLDEYMLLVHQHCQALKIKKQDSKNDNYIPIEARKPGLTLADITTLQYNNYIQKSKYYHTS